MKIWAKNFERDTKVQVLVTVLSILMNLTA